jgi:hypothetical protein
VLHLIHATETYIANSAPLTAYTEQLELFVSRLKP